MDNSTSVISEFNHDSVTQMTEGEYALANNCNSQNLGNKLLALKYKIFRLPFGEEPELLRVLPLASQSWEGTGLDVLLSFGGEMSSSEPVAFEMESETTCSWPCD